MALGRTHSWKKVIAQILLLALPTILLGSFYLKTANSYFSVLQNNWLNQSIYFASGLGTAILFFGYRFRFVTTTAILFIALYSWYSIIGRVSIGEFDAFFASVKFLVFSILFSIGWLCGFGFSRAKYFTIIWSVLLLTTQVVLVSKITDITVTNLITAFVPVLAYAFYIIYTSELIRNMNEDEKSFAWFIGKRLIGFSLIMTLLLGGLFLLFQKDFKALEQEWGGGKAGGQNKGNKESMMKDNKDGSMSNKDQTKLTSSLSKDKRLVFVAHLDNYFADGKTPNPLYFTAYYFTKFDTVTQTFERDSLMPNNDLFRPNPSKIPLYFAKTDSTVIKNTKATQLRKVVTADVYKTLLSPDEFVAPSTAFFCQPRPVEDAYKNQFKSAYRAKMWVSELNSAYFVYNPAGNMQLEMFQQQRLNELKKVNSYAGIEKRFLDYYTFMPSNEEYNRIKELAKDITKNAATPIEKMYAIRDYFLSKDEFNQPLYRYSDNPGIPGLPSASKLNYFLFENRKGYCAYFAGATLFMLRSLGIPSRVTAGFLTVDRSNKNPGWYWFYADQAHAWVQVYFPGYGWIDFDTTVPDENTQQSPQPDGTPPMNTQQAWLVANGKVVSIDTIKKKMQMKVVKMLYHDVAFTTNSPSELLMDVSLASVTKDTGSVNLSEVKKDMEVVAVSYAEVLKNKKPNESDSFINIINKLPIPVPIDEIKIMETDEQKKDRESKTSAEKEPFNWLKAFLIFISAIGGFILLLFASPWLIWIYLHTRAKKQHAVNIKAYNINYAMLYYLNQMGYPRNNLGPAQYAAATDVQWKTNFSSFNNVLQKLKYSQQTLSKDEVDLLQSFYQPTIKAIQQQIPLKIRINKFLNIYNTIHFFSQPKING